MTSPATSASGPIGVILLGVGSIGRELLGQLAGASATRSIRVCGVIDRSGYLFDRDGLSARTVLHTIAHKRQGSAIARMSGAHPAPAHEALGSIAAEAPRSPVLVDATASETGELLEASLARGWDVVLANKIPLAGRQAAADRLLAAAHAHRRRILYEATVGAGLPVLDTAYKLMRTGDRILRIEGCPSGTLGYLFGELGRGRSFSQSVGSAVAAGYTEPDPRSDLSGLDVARKAIILARLIGYRGDVADIATESLVPPPLNRVSVPEFLSRLEEVDSLWDARVTTAAARGRVLRYRARVTRRSVSVGLVAIPKDDPLASLSGTDNQFAFTTTRYRKQPLIIRGPGAGPAVTAAGIHEDLLRIAELRSAPRATLPTPRRPARSAIA